MKGKTSLRLAVFIGFGEFRLLNYHMEFLLKKNPDLDTVNLANFSNKTRIDILWKILANKIVKANKMAKKFLRITVLRGRNVNGHSTRNSLYRLPMRIGHLREMQLFLSGWMNVGRGYDSWFVSQGMGCYWWPRSFANVGYVHCVSGGGH